MNKFYHNLIQTHFQDFLKLVKQAALLVEEILEKKLKLMLLMKLGQSKKNQAVALNKQLHIDNINHNNKKKVRVYLNND